MYVPHFYPLPGVKSILNTLSVFTLDTILRDYRNKGTGKMKSNMLRFL